jgi:predicted ATPase
MQKGLAALRTIGAGIGMPHILALLAESCGRAGRVDEGLSILTEALATADTHEERYYEAEIYRLKGELLLRQDAFNNAEAGSCFEGAIAIARRQSARSFELRATMSLARLLAKLNCLNIAPAIT